MKLNIDEPAPVIEWNNTNDPRHSITIKNLLQQTSGLNFEENYYSKSDVTQMLFYTSDMAAFAASHPLKNKPYSECYYNTGKNNDSSVRRFLNVPTDMFYASGFDGQAIYIISSKKLVVVRLGLTKLPEGEYGANEFLKTINNLIK
ncbi:unnamed protein product [Rotaria sordida]|uniref:Beta-lactamase-related domain-containing protein n=1 Tax=Rotaria sordida TaxID=392033 RepID=A0A820BU26_9BILA|nr:unnamed protein product [Rotaria sordida]CAF0983487.1 unnamed protein product [Rotaria sordida]CAF3841319.1 unnamed protein product [Rotaria sordida]CAF4206479.1 unnamed protein product [Rotaria sordida]